MRLSNSIFCRIPYAGIRIRGKGWKGKVQAREKPTTERQGKVGKEEAEDGGFVTNKRGEMLLFPKTTRRRVYC